jgi:NADPH-dependent 2,4-dienoyl-CoA reductase/sulfur reductase-like enzyme/rhodanese-related sulfurtransferase
MRGLLLRLLQIRNPKAMKKRIVIVGGVAGGASCATRARRLDEEAEIILFERGPYVSFANCGLPYYVGEVIPQEESLLVADAELLRTRFNLDARVRHEVTAIDRQACEVEVKELATGRCYREPYDALVLAPGAAPIRPPLPGIALSGIFTLRGIPDSRDMRQWIEEKKVRSAVVVGAGFIGLEMVENLARRGLRVTVVEMTRQVLPPLDAEMAVPVQTHLVEKGVKLALGDAVAGFESGAAGQLIVLTQSGAAYEGDLVILAIGVRPETGLARSAGLEIGPRGGIRVDAQMRTSDSRIWAVGDAVEVRDFVTGQPALIPLAGPANRQGRIAADVICGRASAFRGSQGTAICGVFGLAAAMTGASEKGLKRAGIADFETLHLHPAQHAGYYPGAQPMRLKLVFRKSDGVILGAQAVGMEGVDKRIDVIAMAIQKGGTIFDLEEAELCYAPQFGSAKDPVNLAGMAAANSARADVVIAPWEAVGQKDFLLLDVRDADEFDRGHITGARNIALPELRLRLGEVPSDREILVCCASGQRSYYACRLLGQHGYRTRNLSGGYKTYLNRQPSAP